MRVSNYIKFQSIILLAAIVTLTYSLPTVNSTQSKKNFCFERVGDKQFCFDTKKKCENQLKDDRIAESPCYNNQN